MKKFELTGQQIQILNMQLIDSGLNNTICCSWNMGKNVKLDALKAALDSLVKMHQVFCVRIFEEDGSYYQGYCEDFPLEFEFASLNADEYDGWARRFAQTNIDFDGALYRFVLVNVEGEYHLFTKIHHIIGDAWSMNIIASDLKKLYSGKTDDAQPAPEYSAYVLKSQEYLTGKRYEKDKKYWQEQIDTEVISLLLSERNDYRLTRLEKRCDTALVKALNALCEENNTTMFALMYFVLGLNFSALTYANDFYLGTTLLNRDTFDEKNTVGMFVNTLPIRVSLQQNETVISNINQIMSTLFKTYRHQRFNYSDCLELVRNNGGYNGAFFDVSMNYQKMEYSTLQNEYVWHPCGTGTDALCIDVQDNGGELSLMYNYSLQAFDEHGIELFHQRFIHTLEMLASGYMEKPLSELQVITEAEESIVLSFNGEYVSYPDADTIVSLFESQVEKTPENIAVVCDGKKLTYAELNARANQVAVKLRTIGVKPDDFVAMLTERSLEMIVGIYGILKAGAAYVPINTIYPDDRIQFILEDCQPKCILTYDAEVPMQTDVPVINLGDESIYTGESTNPERVNKPTDLAYVIYTSGTTGKPKGAMIEHKNVVRLLFNEKFQFDFSDSDVWTMFHSYGFDFSVWEMYGATLYGGKLVVVSNEVSKDAEAFMGLLNDEGVTVLNQVPSSFYNLLSYDSKESCKYLRYVIFGGEALAPARLNEFKSNHPETKIVNMYGITETTVHVTYMDIGDDEIEEGISNIGNAIPTLSIYVMNGMSLCGVGMPGELCVAGEGVARGYLNRPELTAEKFIDNPFGEGKLYRSGDLAKWLPDGTLEYLGRIDDQIKIRGFRVELGDIDAAIRNLDEVEDCAVIAKNDASGEKAIYAYIVSDTQIILSTVRDRLREVLPEYMIPSYMGQIDELPITSNGKLDRRALPEIEAVAREYVAPRNKNEKIICDIFADILGIERVGVKDNFFEIGGHSLRATKVVNRIEAETGVRLSLKNIFTSPTAEALAAQISQASDESYEPIPCAKKRVSYPMSSTQKRMYIINEIDGGGIAYNMAAAIEMKGKLELERVEEVFSALIARHEVLRTSFAMENGEGVQIVSDNIKGKVEHRKIKKAGKKMKEQLLADFVRPFDLGVAPLMRLKLVSVDDESTLLFFDMHHIISDGISANILIDEFIKLYNGSQLPELRVQYKDYSEWMRGRDISAQESYWVERFSDDVPVLDMPLDYARPQYQSFNGSRFTTTIDDETTKRIEALNKNTGTTEYMVLLAALMITLSKYGRQEDVVVGTPISGRTHKDTENMLGMFVNTLAMRGKPEASKTFAQFLAEMKEVCLKAYENQEYPFEDLVEAVGVKRDLSRNPLFDVMFVLQNNDRVSGALEGIDEMSLVAVEDTVAKFDLSVDVSRSECDFRVSFEYCTDLFKAETIEHFAAHYCQILKNAIELPNKKIGELSALNDEENQRVIVEFNDTALSYPKDKTIVELFEEQVENAPDKIAVICDEQKLTYAELNEK
ncbi:MAG: amino acid adenylation domain-containing protein, partial [Clostridia bacterium]|nr:amino acid adenylation domain-containing protein [Clostridia bacterium]